MTLHVRDQVLDAAVAAILANCPSFEGRVYREGALGWDERSYPCAIVLSGRTRVRQLGMQDGYEIEARTTEFSVAVGVREYEGEDPIAALSELLVAVEDAVVALETDPRFDSVKSAEIGTAVVSDDGHGGVAGTILSFVADYYTQKGRSGEIVHG